MQLAKFAPSQHTGASPMFVEAYVVWNIDQVTTLVVVKFDISYEY